jgi:hypothetical protein
MIQVDSDHVFNIKVLVCHALFPLVSRSWISFVWAQSFEEMKWLYFKASFFLNVCLWQISIFMASFLYDRNWFSSSFQHKSCLTPCPLFIGIKIMNFYFLSIKLRREEVGMLKQIYGSINMSNFLIKPNPKLVIITYRPMLPPNLSKTSALQKCHKHCPIKCPLKITFA